MLNQNLKKEGGFTLVELAVVMVIIGLLIAGILKGQELIANAQVTATVAQAQGIEAAISGFQDAYDDMPGDVVNPAVRLPNCNAAPCNVVGNGNGRVDGNPGAAINAGTEPVVAFNHLATGDFLGGILTIPQTAAVNFGDELLETEIGNSGFTIGFAAAPGGATSVINATTNQWRAGHYLGINANAGTAMGASGAGNEALTPTFAARIDRKLDDGLPNDGSVRAGGIGACTNDAGTGALYVESNVSNDCGLFIRVQN